jgi:mannose-6-phosphate isomerase-like protein (cupin superfamily)
MDDAAPGAAVRRAALTMRTLPFLLASVVLTGCTPAGPDPEEADVSRRVRNRFFLREDAAVTRQEPGPHAGTGQTTAYRYFNEVSDARVIFRKRALHPGASIGMHVLSHDEVYYVLSGRGELRVDDERAEVGPGSAVFMHEGADVGIRQLGAEDLVIIIAYPPADAH